MLKRVGSVGLEGNDSRGNLRRKVVDHHFGISFSLPHIITIIVGFCFLYITKFIHKGDHRVQRAARLPSILDLSTGWFAGSSIFKNVLFVSLLQIALRGIPCSNVQSNRRLRNKTRLVLPLGKLLNAKPDLLGGRLPGKVYPLILYKL